jgi:hypothetical protein
LSPAPEGELPRAFSGALSRASHAEEDPGEGIPEGIALRRASHPGEGIPEGITLELADDLAETLRYLARSRGQPLEALTADLLRRAGSGGAAEAGRGHLAGLTPRQRSRPVGGRRPDQPTDRPQLWLSPETVKTHLRRALEHFDLHSKAELRLMLFDLDGDRDGAILFRMRRRSSSGCPREEASRGLTWPSRSSFSSAVRTNPACARTTIA